jgi:hypothetical protein
MRGNASGLEDAGGGPGKSYLFLLTARLAYPGIGLPGDGVEALVKHAGFPRVRCAADGP